MFDAGPAGRLERVEQAGNTWQYFTVLNGDPAPRVVRAPWGPVQNRAAGGPHPVRVQVRELADVRSLFVLARFGELAGLDEL